MTNKEIIKFLTTTTANATILQKLKIRYRPFVCPFDELLGYAENQNSVYDIGCGSGQFCALIAKFTNTKNISGIEISQNLIDNAKEINSQFLKNKKMTFSLFSGSQIPDDIKDYDLIYMIDVYHHIPNEIRDNFMRQLYTKMKPGAKLMLKDIDSGSPLVYLNKIHDLVFAQEIGNEISFKEAKNLLISLGFKVVEARKKRVLVYPHYFLLAEK